MEQRSGPLGAPGVSAEDLVAAVRVHADRVHDAVRRLGCDPDAAAEVVETSALDLVDAVADRPETVEDAVGWWFARARSLGTRVAARSRDLPLGRGVLSVDEDQEVLAEALDELPEPDRFALLLRDSYDLPALSVGAALGTDAGAAMERVGRARLDFLPLVDDEPAPQVPAHQSDLAALARIGEGGPVSARDATTRRHALSCSACRRVTDGQQRAHLLLTGLTVAALPEAERAGILSRVEAAALAALPTGSELIAFEQEREEWDEDVEPRLLSPLIALMLLVVAGIVGVGLGVLLTQSGAGSLSGAGTPPEQVQLLSPPPSPSPESVSPPALEFPAPRTTVFMIPPPSPSPAPSPPSAPSPSPTPTLDELAISLDPSSGPNGERITVSGTGWTAGSEVLLEYLDPTGRPTGSQAVVTVDARGRFTAGISALDPQQLPGEHVVRASDGELVAEATYDAEP